MKKSHLFEVLSYSKEHLAKALSNPITPAKEVKNKYHFRYFCNYFGPKGLGIKTIIIEHQHISQSFLKDYAYYYATCLQGYSPFCRKVHFFSTNITKEDLYEVITNPNKDASEIWKNYAGYITVKPLPDAKLGATVIKPLARNRKAKYTAVRSYDAYFFGKKLKINSLSFQEQDKVISRCATIAVWTALHKASQHFQVTLPAPVEITLAANEVKGKDRIIPSEGLETVQIMKAFESFGVLTEHRTELETKDYSMVRRFVYAYLKKGFPVLVGIRQKNENTNKEENHIVTFVGYQKPGTQKTESSDKTHFLADDIDHFYAHDDQTGPFSSHTFSTNVGSSRIDVSRDKTLFQQKANQDAKNEYVVCLLATVTHMIKIAYEDIQKEIFSIDAYFRLSLPNMPLSWDIYLTPSTKYLHRVRKKPDYAETIKYLTLNTFCPRYLWIARGAYKGLGMVEFVFDATGLRISKDLCLLAFPLPQDFLPFLLECFNQNPPAIQSQIKGNLRSLSKLENSANFWNEFLNGGQ